MELRIKDRVVLYDKADQGLVDSRKWHINDSGYAVWRALDNGVKKTLRLHRLINKTPDGMITDHINHNRLDNRRSNLRTVTQQENMRNLTDQGRGYNWHGQNHVWSVETMGQRISGFKNEEDAIAVVKLLRSGGKYIKPVRTVCRYGHSLQDAYVYNNSKSCKTCALKRANEFYRRNKI